MPSPMAKKLRRPPADVVPVGYDIVLGDVARVIEEGRYATARSVNAVMTPTYWLVGRRRLVEEEQEGSFRARYGETLVDRLATDLTSGFGRGFGRRNLFQMRAFYIAYGEIVQTLSAQSMGRPVPHLYLNFAREHWTMSDENPPVGLILCAKRDHAVAKYVLGGLRNKVLAAEYRTALPTERLLVEEIEKTRRQIEGRRKARGR